MWRRRRSCCSVTEFHLHLRPLSLFITNPSTPPPPSKSPKLSLSCPLPLPPAATVSWWSARLRLPLPTPPTCGLFPSAHHISCTTLQSVARLGALFSTFAIPLCATIKCSTTQRPLQWEEGWGGGVRLGNLPSSLLSQRLCLCPRGSWLQLLAYAVHLFFNRNKTGGDVQGGFSIPSLILIIIFFTCMSCFRK